MTSVLDCWRALLKLGWLIPVAWMLGAGIRASIGPIMPVYLFVGFPILLIALWPHLQGLLDTKRLMRFRAPVVMAMALIAGFLVELAASLGGAFSLGELILTCVLLVATTLVALRIIDQDVDYETILGDFRFGILGLVVLLAVAAALGHKHASFGPLVYAGVAGYGLVGIFGLALGRRFAVDDASIDERPHGLESDWLLSLLVLLGGLGLVALLLAQVFAFDIVGAVGNMTQPLQSAAIHAITFVGASIAGFVAWLIHFLPFHPPKLRPPVVKPPPVRHPQPQPVSHRPHPGKPLPASVILALKAIGILIAGMIALAILSLAVKVARVRRPAPLRGEQRTTNWSWRKMAGWMFRRTRDELGRLVPAQGVHLSRRHRYTSVRDVYRALLAFGSLRARPRMPSETGLEYSHELAGRWKASSDPLRDLNALYLEERYGSRPPSPALVARARSDLHAVEAAAEAVETRP